MLKNKKFLAVIIPIFLGGCADYMNHRDTVTLGAGNAMELNTAIHEQKPWPRYVSNTTIITHGNLLPAGAVKKKK